MTFPQPFIQMYKKLQTEDIKRLPNLVELVKSLEQENEKLVQEDNGWQNCKFISSPIPFTSRGFSGNDFLNDASPEKFIVVRTARGRHTLKPNLNRKKFLYRGQNAVYPHLLSSFSREDENITPFMSQEEIKKCRERSRRRHLVSNLKLEEFIDLLRSHPLFMMFDRGVVLDPYPKPFFFNMNYYGLAQHYGFKTAEIDFTTDINVAAFFACTKNSGDDVYTPITDIKKYPYGAIYVHRIIPDFTFKFLFSTIGLQLYPRSGAQKGVLFEEAQQANQFVADKITNIYYFRHDPYSSTHFFKLMDCGKKLFPEDRIAQYAKQIIHGNEISGNVFAQNLYSNQEDFQINMNVLEENNINVNWGKRMSFTPNMLHDLSNDLKNGLWEDFCNQIDFGEPSIDHQLHDTLLSLPQNPLYSHYFKPKYYERLHAYDCNLHSRAIKNSKCKLN